jgi:hypothetical protein
MLKENRNSVEKKFEDSKLSYVQEKKISDIIDQISKILDLNEDINFKTFSNMKNDLEGKLNTENTQKIQDQIDSSKTKQESVENINEKQIQQEINIERIINIQSEKNSITCDFYFRELSELFSGELEKADSKKYTDICIALLKNSTNDVCSY